MKYGKTGFYRHSFLQGPPCHSGPVQVIENLYCGSEEESIVMASPKIRVDTLVPLYMADAKIWSLGFRGEILYYPIKDFGALPDDVLEELIAKIVARLKDNKKVGLFCNGGHGRTGYVAAVVLGKLGHRDPIAYLREHYCGEAVESDAQVRHIAAVLDKPELVRKYEINANKFGWPDEFSDCELEEFGVYPHKAHTAMHTDGHPCGGCIYFSRGRCALYGGCLVSPYDPPCSAYEGRP